jgi:hypothetical protein
LRLRVFARKPLLKTINAGVHTKDAKTQSIRVENESSRPIDLPAHDLTIRPNKFLFGDLSHTRWDLSAKEWMRMLAFGGNHKMQFTNKTIREIALEAPLTTRVFEEFKIDYCCGGRVDFAEACQNAGVDARSVQQKLESVIGSEECKDDRNASIRRFCGIKSCRESFLRRRITEKFKAVLHRQWMALIHGVSFAFPR